jgi:hypothetical protein
VGADSFLEPFRWEQRLYTIALTTDPNHWGPHIGVMSDAVGGQFWLIHSVKHMIQCMENCHGLAHPRRHINVQPVHPVCHIEGVSVILESHPGNASSFVPERMFIYANQTVTKHFPIPENFWPGQYYKETGQFGRFPPRNAHPTFYVSTKDEVHRIYEGFPCDRLSIETSQFLSQLLKRPKGTCWSLFAKNSSQKHGMGYPFGFFRVSNSGNAVNFYVLPYNFPKLFKILHKLTPYKGQAVPSGILLQLSDYLREIPPYYHQPTLKALAAIQFGNLSNAIPVDSIVVNLAKHCEKIIQQATIAMIQFQTAITTEQNASHDQIPENIYQVPIEKLERQISTFADGILQRNSNLRSLLTQEELDDIHSIPIADMGEYVPIMQKIQTLRDPREEEEERKEREKGLFGNPYRKQKKLSPSLSKSDQDSVMESLNEMEEEGSHEFRDEPNKANATNRKRKLLAIKEDARKRIPPLSTQTVLLVPNFEHLSWSTIKEMDYSKLLSEFQELQKERLGMITADLKKEVVSEPTMIVESDSEPSTPAPLSSDNSLDSSMDPDDNVATVEEVLDWKVFRKQVYDNLALMEKCIPILLDYNEEVLIEMISKYFQKDGRHLDKIRYLYGLAKSFRRPGVANYIQKLM